MTDKLRESHGLAPGAREQEGAEPPEDDSRRAFPLAAAALMAVLFLVMLLTVNWVC
ncbi:hypothetical protein [Candidatus Methylocalor cossyra]|uniref:Uncharacterized protein n=1 Tax=Candidatus Methylocalor cossyra TaxID=3108543 RepID=A0ABM9NIS8_9GAMM